MGRSCGRFDISIVATTGWLTQLSPVIYVLGTKKSSPMSMLCSRQPSCASTRSTATTSPVPLTKAASRAIPSVAFVVNAFTATTSYMPIVEIDTNDAISVIVALPTASNNTTLTTMPLRLTSRRTIFFAWIRSVWRRSLLSLSPAWISRRIS